MGIQEVKKLHPGKEKQRYISQLLDDIYTLDILLEEDLFEKKSMYIGAEQEFCLVDKNWRPANKALDLLERVQHRQFTTELALYNLEINSSAQPLKAGCFKKLENELTQLLEYGRSKAEEIDIKLILTGILPSINFNHVNLSFMTPMVRYNVLNDAIRKMRKQNFEIHIQGLDEIHLKHNSIIYEGCNTSFQAHLQIVPENFKTAYNWAQYISGPVLAIAANSPLLLRKQLWHETRIALFCQSVDTRTTSFLLNDREPRVGFGRGWQQGNAAAYFKDSVTRFKSIISKDMNEYSSVQLEQGKIPKLSALQLHNGTDYRWNRLCYGTQQLKPHLRIENRYLPSGPTVKDEMANFCFWVGLMHNMPEELNNLEEQVPFYVAKLNFFNAARLGLESPIIWKKKAISARKLIADELLPLAYEGLVKVGIDASVVNYYLNILQKRIFTHTGAEWILTNYRKITNKHSPSIATKLITRALHENTAKYDCVADWPALPQKKYFRVENHPTVSAYMKTHMLTVSADETLQMVKKIMEWNFIHHVPVVKNQQELLGIISWTDIQNAEAKGIKSSQSIRKIFQKPVLSIQKHQTMVEAEKLMSENKISCLPVTHENMLMGIVTKKDIEAWKQY